MDSTPLRKASNKLAGNKDVPVKQFLFMAIRPDAARSEAQRFMRSAAPSQRGVPHK
jgi:hypothetical protein